MRSAVILLLALFVLLPACKVRQEGLTDWFRVEVRGPATGDSSVIVVGPPKRQTYFALAGGRWHSLGAGHAGNALRLGDDEAVLYRTAYDAQQRIIYRGETAGRPVAEVFQAKGDASIPPSRRWIDFADCLRMGGEGKCVEAAVTRYDLQGGKQWTRALTLDNEGKSCHFSFLNFEGYDADEDPYLIGSCRGEPNTCLLVGLKGGGAFRFEAADPWNSAVCLRNWYFRNTPGPGVSLQEPVPFDLHY